MTHDAGSADCRLAFITTRHGSEGSPEHVARFQARRVDKSNAGGVSHRYSNKRNLRPEGPAQGRMCRPFRPESQCFLSPVAHATGRGCAGLPALTEKCNLRKRQRDITNAAHWTRMHNPSLTCRVVLTHDEQRITNHWGRTDSNCHHSD